MDRTSSPIRVTCVEDVTTDWLSSVLDTNIASYTSKRIGTGQVSTCYRLFLSYNPSTQNPGPATLILKVASTDPKSRQSGLSLGLYEREVHFYEVIAPILQTAVPKCYHTSYSSSSGAFTLLLSDADGSATGDDIEGAGVEQTRAAVVALGTMHGTMLRDTGFAARAKWFARPSPITQRLLAALFAEFEQRYGERLSAEHLHVCRRLVDCYDAFQEIQRESRGPQGLVHGDYRLDNLLFGDQGLVIVDWQTLFVGPLLSDLAYFLGCAVRIEDRQAHADEFVDIYLAALGPGNEITREMVQVGLREQSFFGVVMGIVSPMMVERTERGDEMFMTMMERHCTAVLDLMALEILPNLQIPIPLCPDPDDEQSHPPTDDQFWNESWYFDLVDEKSEVGVYVRLGHSPNLEGSMYTAVITHPTKHLVTVTDYKCPHPGSDLAVKTERFQASQVVVVPLKEYRVMLKGQGEQYDDPAAVLSSKKGKDVDVDLDITWHTNGVPYAWRMTTRYEIPCRATGSITINGEEISFKDVVAQRDHSHGVRDWVCLRILSFPYNIFLT